MRAGPRLEVFVLTPWYRHGSCRHMIVPVALFSFSILAVCAAVIVPAWADTLLFSGPSAVASSLLVLQKLRTQRHSKKWIILDGSNVMHWDGGNPSILPVQMVIAMLSDEGYSPGVIFDANAGYLVAGKYYHDEAFAKLLGLPEDQVMVVPKGTPADQHILSIAKDLGAKIVTNDKYRDWLGQYPEASSPGYLVGGQFQQGKPKLHW